MGTVVVGHFLRQDKKVEVTLEAVDVKNNKVIWTGSLTAPADNLIVLRNQMARKVRQELVPALGIAREAVENSSAPANREAYDLYLRTLAMAHDGAANKEAIAIAGEGRGGARSELRSGMGSARTAVLLRCHVFGRRRGGSTALERGVQAGPGVGAGHELARPDFWRRTKSRPETSTRLTKMRARW